MLSVYVYKHIYIHNILSEDKQVVYFRGELVEEYAASPLSLPAQRFRPGSCRHIVERVRVCVRERMVLRNFLR